MEEIKKLITDKILDNPILVKLGYKNFLYKEIEKAEINIKGNQILVIWSDGSEYCIEI